MHTGYPFFLGGILDNRFQSRELVLQFAVVDLGLQFSESRVNLIKGLQRSCVNACCFKDFLVVYEAVALDCHGHAVDFAVLGHIVQQAAHRICNPGFCCQVLKICCPVNDILGAANVVNRRLIAALHLGSQCCAVVIAAAHGFQVHLHAGVQLHVPLGCRDQSVVDLNLELENVQRSFQLFAARGWLSFLVVCGCTAVCGCVIGGRRALSTSHCQTCDHHDDQQQSQYSFFHTVFLSFRSIFFLCANARFNNKACERL